MTDAASGERPSGEPPDGELSGDDLPQVAESVAQEANAESIAAEAVESDLDKMLGERNEMRALAQQLQADFENYRKQAMKREAAIVERASAGLVEKLLPVLDSFEAAVGALPEDADDGVRKGIELVYAQLVTVLESAGLARIDADGARFDPHEHEAVIHEDGDGEPMVTATMRAGYRLKDRVIRPAMVKVAK